MSASPQAFVLPRGPLLVFSPHCDDAVFACGELLRERRGAVVATVFAAGPERYGAPTDWDRRAGFGAGEDVMAVRRAEDRRALARLGARPLWLGYRDRQYAAPPTVGELTRALGAVLAAVGAEVVAAPLGLFHSDHALVHEAVLAALRRAGRRTCVLYADAFYRRIPGLLEERLAALEAAGYELHDLAAPDRAASPVKQRAIACYASQLLALASEGRPGTADAYAPERRWLARGGRADAREIRRDG